MQFCAMFTGTDGYGKCKSQKINHYFNCKEIPNRTSFSSWFHLPCYLQAVLIYDQYTYSPGYWGQLPYPTASVIPQYFLLTQPAISKFIEFIFLAEVTNSSQFKFHKNFFIGDSVMVELVTLN